MEDLTNIFLRNNDESLTEKESLEHIDAVIQWLLINAASENSPFDFSDGFYLSSREKLEPLMSDLFSGNYPTNTITDNEKYLRLSKYFNEVSRRLKKLITMGKVPHISKLGDSYFYRHDLNELILDTLSLKDHSCKTQSIQILDLQKSFLGDDIKNKEFLDINEACNFIKISSELLWEYVNQGVVLYVVYKGVSLYRKSDLQNVIDRTLKINISIKF